MYSDASFLIELPFTDSVLLLSPRLGEWGETAQWTTLALLALVPLALVIWLYRFELRMLTRGTALTLLSLRLAVILLLWCVICLQPSITRITTATRELPTRVLVGVDLSGSMNATDPARPAVDKLRLARALKLEVVSEPATRKLLDDWIGQYGKKNARGAPQWIADDEFPGDDEQRRKAAGERKALHDRICAEVDALSRAEITLHLLTADDGKLLRDLSRKHQVEIVGFHENLVDLNPEQLGKLLQVLKAIKPRGKQDDWQLKPELSARIFGLGAKELDALLEQLQAIRARQPEDKGALPAEDLDRLLRQVQPQPKLAVKGRREAAREKAVTDLSLPLELSLEPAKPGQGELIGVVLLTDGRHNATSAQEESSPDETAEELGKQRVPIFPVVLGTAQTRPSVTIAEVQAPPNASAKNVDVTIRVRFKVAGMKKQDVVVSLERVDKRDKQPPAPPPIIIAHNGIDQYYDRSFVVSMDPEGKPLQTFLVSIKPVEKVQTGTPSQQVVVKLDEAKSRVLIVDGEARWEYHYLANALLRDPTVQIQRVLFEPPLRDPNLSDTALKQMGNPQRKLPAGPDALAGFQCIVLGDVPPEQLPLKDRQRLEQFVSKHGGTLIIVAGKRFTPLAYTRLTEAADAKEGGASGGPETDPLLKLLPIEEPRVIKPERGFPVTLTREGKTTPFLRMETDAAESEQRWAGFPKHYWGIIGRAKPAATALAYYRDRSVEGVRPTVGKAADDDELKISREQALMARHTYGRGQVLYVGLDSTWRWRYRIGDTYHHRFWGQVIRWASSDYIRFGTDKPVYQEGQDVTVDLDLADRGSQAMPEDGKLTARVNRVEASGRKGKTVRLVTLNAQEGLRVLKGQVRNLEAGRYQIELDRPSPDLAARLGERPPTEFLVTPRDNKEMDHLETNEDLLRDLAEKSGSRQRLFTPVTAGKVVDLLPKRVVTLTEHTPPLALWREWWTLVAFLVLITAEWVGRKWGGLP
jgi:hypothetical protein